MDDGNAKSWWGEWDAGVCQKPYPFRCRNKNDLTAISNAATAQVRMALEKQQAAEMAWDDIVGHRKSSVLRSA